MTSGQPEWMNAASDEEVAALAAANPGWKQRKVYEPPTFTAASAVQVSTERERNNALAALASEAAELAAVGQGQRNDELNRRTWKMWRKYGAFGHLSSREIYDALMHASRINGHVQQDGSMAHNTCSKALAAAEAEGGAVAPVIEWHEGPPPNVVEVGSINGHSVESAGTNGHTNGTADANGRSIVWQTANQVADAVPIWAWNYAGKGRIQLGTLALFAGRPGVGKSNAARWLVSEATTGNLGGCWQGRPCNVAYIATEEPERYTVVPGLRAAGADLSRVHFPRAYQNGQHSVVLSSLDEAKIGQYCLDNEIRIVVVDALMTTMGGSTNINQNNEVRAMLTPWSRIAEEIHGIVIGVSHLRKANNGDVVAAINGSSAFGEVARSIFAFAKRQDDDQRVMSQHKNSTGYEDLAVNFELRPTTIMVSTGETADVAKFVITGNSEVTVEDILADGMTGVTTIGECTGWLHDYMMVNGPEIDSKEVKKDGKKEGYESRTIQRAAQKLRMKYVSRGMPRSTFWVLPEVANGRSFSEPERDQEDEGL